MAVASINTPHLESVRATIEAAEELNLPVILQFAELHESLNPLDIMGPIMLDAAKNAKVPVCVHLDHGETFECIRKALAMGFTSVMYDGSVLPYEENVMNTRKVVEWASMTGASVEAELGSMGKREASGIGEETEEGEEPEKIYTDPDQAADFVRRTGIDALACSFGTTHGLYQSEPKLDFDIVREVRRKADNIPVVMHGGSGVSASDYRKGVGAGVRKVNYFTYMDKAGGAAAMKYFDKLQEGDTAFFSPVVDDGRKAMKEDIKRAMKTFALWA